MARQERKRPPTAAEMKRLAMRNRVIEETGGRCQECGALDGGIVDMRTHFAFLCAKCARAVYAAASALRGRVRWS